MQEVKRSETVMSQKARQLTWGSLTIQLWGTSAWPLSNLGRENKHRVAPACLLCHLGRAGTGSSVTQPTLLADQILMCYHSRAVSSVRKQKNVTLTTGMGNKDRAFLSYCISWASTVMSYHGLGHIFNTLAHSLGFDLSQQGCDCSACAVTLHRRLGDLMKQSFSHHL